MPSNVVTFQPFIAVFEAKYLFHYGNVITANLYAFVIAFQNDLSIKLDRYNSLFRVCPLITNVVVVFKFKSLEDFFRFNLQPNANRVLRK